MALSQTLQQKLLQKLSPQQIQLMKLLQVPTANLEERIKEELEENPALEQTEEDHDDNYDEKDEFESGEDEYEADGSETDYDNIDLSEYVRDGDDDIADYKLRDDNYPEADDNKTVPIRIETSFHEMLADQLGMLKLDERMLKIAEQIVGSIDDDGYLRRETTAIVDDLAFRQNIMTSEEEVESIIKKIQAFDPPGVAARDLQECLLLQLNRLQDEARLPEGQGKNVSIAIRAISKYFDEFTKKHYEKIQRGLDLTDEQLKDVMQQITRLNPKPGGNVGEINKAESYVVPDFFIMNNGGKLELTRSEEHTSELQ